MTLLEYIKANPGKTQQELIKATRRTQSSISGSLSQFMTKGTITKRNNKYYGPGSGTTVRALVRELLKHDMDLEVVLTIHDGVGHATFDNVSVSTFWQKSGIISIESDNQIVD